MPARSKIVCMKPRFRNFSISVLTHLRIHRPMMRISSATTMRGSHSAITVPSDSNSATNWSQKDISPTLFRGHERVEIVPRKLSVPGPIGVVAGFPFPLSSGSLPSMATDKRERQRANRAEKQAAEAKKQASREHSSRSSRSTAAMPSSSS